MKNQSGYWFCRLSAAALLALASTGCNSTDYSSQPEAAMDRINAKPQSSDVVTCMLPGQVRQLGRNFTYLSPRRETRLSAYECEVRGGQLAMK